MAQFSPLDPDTKAEALRALEREAAKEPFTDEACEDQWHDVIAMLLDLAVQVDPDTWHDVQAMLLERVNDEDIVAAFHRVEKNWE